MSGKQCKGPRRIRSDTCVIGLGTFGSYMAQKAHELSGRTIPAMGITVSRGGCSGRGVSTLRAWPPTEFSRSLDVSLAEGGKRTVDLTGLKQVQLVGGVFGSAFRRCYRPLVDRFVWSDVTVAASFIMPFPFECDRTRARRLFREMGRLAHTTFLFPNGHFSGKRTPEELGRLFDRTDRVVVDQLLFSAAVDEMFFFGPGASLARLVSRGRYSVYSRLAAGERNRQEFFGNPPQAVRHEAMTRAAALSIHLKQHDVRRSEDIAWSLTWDSEHAPPQTIFSAAGMPSNSAAPESVVALDIPEEVVERLLFDEKNFVTPFKPTGWVQAGELDIEDREIPAYLRKARKP